MNIRMRTMKGRKRGGEYGKRINRTNTRKIGKRVTY